TPGRHPGDPRPRRSGARLPALLRDRARSHAVLDLLLGGALARVPVRGPARQQAGALGGDRAVALRTALAARVDRPRPAPGAVLAAADLQRPPGPGLLELHPRAAARVLRALVGGAAAAEAHP